METKAAFPLYIRKKECIISRARMSFTQTYCGIPFTLQDEQVAESRRQNKLVGDIFLLALSSDLEEVVICKGDYINDVTMIEFKNI